MEQQMRIDEQQVQPPLQNTPTNAVETEKTSIVNETDQDLLYPYGIIRPQVAIPASICLLGIIIFYSRFIDFGSITVNWLFQFNMNIAMGIVTVLAGALVILPTALRAPRELARQNNLTALIVTTIVAIFFFRGTFDLGTFTYTQIILDIDTILVLAFSGLALILAQRGSRIALAAVILITLWWAVTLKEFGIKTFTDLFDSPNGLRITKELVPPHWISFRDALDPLFVTIKVAIVSTLLGVTAALPLSILAARNTTPHPILYNVVRAFVNLVRAVPALFVALLLIPFTGLGDGTGIFALGLHTMSVLTKIFAESIEAVPTGPIEALRAAGANNLKQFRWGMMPQALPVLASYSLFTFESNVRDSTVLAFIGGGGIGFLLMQEINLLAYHEVSVLLAMLIFAVILLDRVSDYLRSKII
jgi:phosphonate ABC transporter permease subunit PhnE